MLVTWPSVLPLQVGPKLRAMGRDPVRASKNPNRVTWDKWDGLLGSNQVQDWNTHDCWLVCFKMSNWFESNPPPHTHTFSISNFWNFKLVVNFNNIKNRSINFMIHTQQNACIKIQEMVLVHACMAPVPSPFPEFKMTEFLSPISGNKRHFMFCIDTSASSC